jgi:acetylornithine/N-succinyldiaminopimelate aminotransferase
MKQRLASVVDAHRGAIDEVRGEGLLLGIHCVAPAADVVNAMREQGLLAPSAGDNVVRLVPRLNVEESEIDEAIVRLDRALAALQPAVAGR